MTKGKLEIILENLMNEGTEDMFRTKIDPINIYVANVDKWSKYVETFGERKFDDTETENFTVIWDADFDYKSDGIYGVGSTIERVYGTIDFFMYDDGTNSDQQKASLEFDKADFDKMTLLNEPKFNEYGQLAINGVDIDFKRNTVTIEYF
jgi:hypothetical protein